MCGTKVPQITQNYGILYACLSEALGPSDNKGSNSGERKREREIGTNEIT